MDDTRTDADDREQALAGARERLDEIRATLAEYSEMPQPDIERIRHKIVELERCESELAKEIETLEAVSEC